MRVVIAAIIFLSVASAAIADELPLLNGRFQGQVVVFNLSIKQQKIIDHFESCHLNNSKEMNVYTPYIFELEKDQQAYLRSIKGYSPRYFEIYQTYKGFNEAGPHWNLALQFSKDKIEIPLALLLTEKQARRAHKVQGWHTTNPCFPKIGKK